MCNKDLLNLEYEAELFNLIFLLNMDCFLCSPEQCRISNVYLKGKLITKQTHWQLNTYLLYKVDFLSLTNGYTPHKVFGMWLLVHNLTSCEFKQMYKELKAALWKVLKESLKIVQGTE